MNPPLNQAKIFAFSLSLRLILSEIMNTLILPNSHSLIEEIVSNLTNSGKDFSDYLIVFPGKRPSHFIRKALAQREKGSLIPPIIFSIDAFIDHVFEKEFSLFEKKIEPIDSVAILFKLHKMASKPLGGKSFISADSFFPIGLKIFNTLEELYIEGIEHQRVREIENISSKIIPEQSAGTLQSISYFYDEFYKELKRQQYSTRSFRYRAVSEKINFIDLSRLKKIIFAGFFALTHSERNLFNKISSWDNSLFIFQEGAGLEEKLRALDLNYDNIKRRGSATEWSFRSGEQTKKTCSKNDHLHSNSIERTSTSKKREKRKEADFFFYQSPDTHGQVFGLSRIIKTHLEKNIIPGENTVFVLPSSETLFPLFHQTLPLLDKDDYNISMGYPLHRTPVFGFFNNLMNLLTSMEGDLFYTPDYLKFILHPYTKNIFFNKRADVSRIMFHSLESKFADKRTKTLISLHEIEEDNILFNEMSKKFTGINANIDIDINVDILKEHLKFIHRNTICKFRTFENIKDFSLKSTEILTYIYRNSTARLHPFFYPFYEEFIKSFDSISGSLLKDMSFNETTGYFNFFRKYIMICRTPFEGTPVKGLQVLGFLETRNLRFSRVFILDANEEVLPNAGKEDSLLPYKVREMLGIPTYRDREKLSAYYFDTLIKGAKEVHIFFVEKNKKEKSRFVEKLIWQKQKKDKKTDSKDYIKSINYKVKLHSRDPFPARKTNEIITFLLNYTYSATSLDVYLRCPLMFYYQYVLNLGEKKLVTGEIEKAEIGTFVHKLLKTYFQNKKGKLLDKKDINFDEMDELADRLFKEDFGKELSGTAYLVNIQVKKRMKEFLEKYQIPLLEKNKIEIIELEHKLKTSIHSFNLKGSLDRIEKRSGKIYVIDYKTSANDQYLKINFRKLDPADRNNWSDSIGSLQLPFYLTLFTAKTGRTVENTNGAFLTLGRVAMDEKTEIPLFQSLEEASNYFPILQNIIFKLLHEIVNPDIPFEPVLKRDKTCSTCLFHHICGA